MVDTSVWIDFFDHPQSSSAKKLQALIETDEEICLADINLTEILQGIREEKTFEQIKYYLTQFPILQAKSIETHIHAAQIYRSCRKMGKSMTKTIDALIAAVAIENGCRIFHNDNDFELIALCAPLKIYNPPHIK